MKHLKIGVIVNLQTNKKQQEQQIYNQMIERTICISGFSLELDALQSFRTFSKALSVVSDT